MAPRSARPLARLVAAPLLGIVLSSLPTAVRADTTVPNAYDGAAASTSGINSFIRDNGVAITYQMQITADQLTAISPGTSILGITFRMWTGAGATPFPATAATWTNYTLTLGPGVGLASDSMTFATNFSSPGTVVRTGPLTIPASSFPVGATFPTPNAFGPFIPFTTPYVYSGGDLIVELRHTGSNIVNAFDDSVEAVPGADPHYNVNVAAIAGTGDTATTGVFTSFTTVRFQTEPVPVELLSVGVE